ncbi:MAG TPA: DNA helicase UvrD [Candidatus Aenigmarchaeota archaeon]|nr:DNA helicase UvrD [Candidatus Aenigmarchaeota archaeon]
MIYLADLHIHSKYSRATSRLMDLKHLATYAKMKGLHLLGTGDFTHPKWLEELSCMEEQEGIYIYDDMNFLVTGEVSTVYEQGGKLRRVHHLILLPSLESAELVSDAISKHANLEADGRPTLPISSPELVETILSLEPKALVIPAHAWTPWFGVLGSKSGFDSLRECYQDQTRHIYGLETGLSSDPAMNWRLSELDGLTLISNSDSHSPYPWRIGREANAFDLRKLSYEEVYKAIRYNRLAFTIEVDPSYGKYHWDGHRNCGVRLEPKEAMRLGNICPVCGRPLTLGVLHRVEELADRPEGFVPEGARPFKSLLPLHELISSVYHRPVSSQSVWNLYHKFVNKFGNEYEVLLNADTQELKEVDRRVADIIGRMREGRLEVKPGYDGVYGELIVEKRLTDFT